MPDKVTELWRKLEPFATANAEAIARRLAVSAGGGGGGGTTVDLTGYLTQTSADARYLKLTGGTMAGDIAMPTLGLVDSVDISVHVADPDAHHARQHGIVTAADHSVTGSALDLVGLTAANTLGLLTPSSDVSAGVAAILKSTSGGVLRLAKVEVGATPAVTIFGTDNPAVNPDLEFTANGSFAAEASIYHLFDSDNSGTGSLCVWGINGRTTGTMTEIMRLTETGRLGIGETNPSYALDVVGTIQGQTAVRSASLIATTAVTTPSIITASGNLSITPVGYVAFDDATNVRSATWTAGFLGAGWGLSYPSPGLARLDIRQIYAEQLEVTAFIADTIRVNAGETWLGPSMGITALDFTMPAANSSTVRIYFEDNPAISGQLFTTGDYVLIQYINRDGGGLTVTQYWGTVNTYIDGAVGSNQQSWLFTLRSGATGVAMNIQKGMVVVGFGASGAGYIHNSVLTGGPFTRYGSWTTNPYTPANRTYHVQVGNLVNLVDYGSTAHYGLAAGKTLGVGITTYSGLTVDETNGLRIFNASIALYLSGTQTVDIGQTGTMWLGPSSGDKRFYFDGTTLRIGGAGSTAWEIQAGSIVSSNVRIISGSTTNARVEVGDGAASTNVQSAVAGLRGGDGTTLSGIAFWAGRPHAYRTSAPFYVTMGGSLRADDATLTGSFTAGNVTITPGEAMKIAVTSSFSNDAAIRFMRGAVMEGVIGAYTGYMTLIADGFLYLGGDSVYLPAGTNLTVTDDASATNVTATRHKGGAATSYLTAYGGTDIVSFTATAFTSTVDVTAPALRVASGTGYLKVGSTNVVSFSATTFQTTLELGEASWTALAYDSAFTATRTGTVYVKRFGDQVFYRGSCKSSSASGDVAALTIPNGYTRPSSTIIIYLPRSNGNLIKATIVGNSSGGGTISFTGYTAAQDIYFDNVALLAS
jgi:hypothetical protein